MNSSLFQHNSRQSVHFLSSFAPFSANPTAFSAQTHNFRHFYHSNAHSFITMHTFCFSDTHFVQCLVHWHWQQFLGSNFASKLKDDNRKKIKMKTSCSIQHQMCRRIHKRVFLSAQRKIDQTCWLLKNYIIRRNHNPWFVFAKIFFENVLTTRCFNAFLFCLVLVSNGICLFKLEIQNHET